MSQPLWILDQVQYDGVNVQVRHSRVGGNPQGRGGLVVRIRIIEDYGDLQD